MRILKIWFLVALAVLIGEQSLAQENAPVKERMEWLSLQEAQQKAKETNKKVYLFGYTEWCGYCRKTRKETFTSDSVLAKMDKFYYAVQINAESEKEIVFNNKTYKENELARLFQIQSFPTHFFITSNGEIIGSQPGFLPPDVFAPLLSYVGTGSYGKMSFQDYMEKEK